jgi:isocitrate/isopropylmalate dehydrogenase
MIDVTAARLARGSNRSDVIVTEGRFAGIPSGSAGVLAGGIDMSISGDHET